MVSILGSLHVRFAYYHCRHCKEGPPRWQATLGLTSQALTPGASELTALAGVLGNFAEAAEKTLVKLSGLRVSESTVQRSTEEAGARVRKRLAAGERLAAPQAWDWNRDAAGRRCAYMSVDATGVRRQGPGGAGIEGRMAYVGMLYNPAPRGEKRPMDQRRYLAGFYDLESLGRQLHAQAMDVGWLEADVEIALSDGANGLEKFVRTYFPRAQLILDFWHAAEHLAELARASTRNEADCEAARTAWCGRLKQEGGAALLAELEQLDLSGRGDEARETCRREVEYVRHNVHRMDYPRYLAQGWQIGSGPVEAACKTVVGQRLKGSGMRWGDDGADAVCALRAVYLSDQALWESLWRRPPASPHITPEVYLQN